MGAEGADLLILFLLGAGKTQLLSRFRSDFLDLRVMQVSGVA